MVIAAESARGEFVSADITTKMLKNVRNYLARSCAAQHLCVAREQVRSPSPLVKTGDSAERVRGGRVSVLSPQVFGEDFHQQVGLFLIVPVETPEQHR